MFGIVLKLQGASHLLVECADGKTRMCRIPGKMRKRSWVRTNDLVILKPWDVENAKADVVFRYTRTQRSYLKRRRIIPPGME